MKTGCVKHSKEATKAKDAVRFDHFQCLGFVRVSSKNKIKFEKYPAQGGKLVKQKRKKSFNLTSTLLKTCLAAAF